jgi:hypothetical protein
VLASSMRFLDFHILTRLETGYLHQVHYLARVRAKLGTALRPDGDFNQGRYALKSISSSQFFLIEYLVGGRGWPGLELTLSRVPAIKYCLNLLAVHC